MYTFRVTYTTKNGQVKQEYIKADHGAEAQRNAKEDCPDLKKIIKVEQL